MSIKKELLDINPIALFCFEPNFTAIVTVTKDCKGGLAGEDGVRIGFMSPLIYCLLARYLRYTKKIILGGKRRLRYQLYACGYFFCMP